MSQKDFCLSFRRIVSCVLMFLIPACICMGRTAIIQDGQIIDSNIYSGTESTWLDSANPDTNYGVNGICRVGYQNGGAGVYRTLIRFGQLSHFAGIDTGIAPDAILSAKLVLTTDTAFAGTGTCELRIIDSNDQDWTELYSTWNKKRTDVGPLDWSGGPGLGSVYGDVADTVIWSTGQPVGTEMELELTGAALTILKGWLTGDNTSGGFLLKAQSESGSGDNYIDFYSEQTADSNTVKPKLVIEYIPTAKVIIQDGQTIAGNAYNGTSSVWVSSLNNTTSYVNVILRAGNQYDDYFEVQNIFRSFLRFNSLSHWHGVDTYSDLGCVPGTVMSARVGITTDTAFEGSGICQLRAMEPNESQIAWQPTYTTWSMKRSDLSEPWLDGPGGGSNYSGVIDTVSFNNGQPLETQMFFDVNDPNGLRVIREWLSGDDTGGSFMFRTEVEDSNGFNYFDFWSERTTTGDQDKPMLELTYIPTEIMDIQDGLLVGGSAYDGTESTWLNDGAPNTSYGLNSGIRVGYQYPAGSFQSTFRALIRFGQLSHYAGIDIGIDPNNIVAAQLVLTADPSFVGNDDVELRIVDPNDQDWTEMYCTWNYKRTDIGPLQWSGGPGLGSVYGDIIDTEYVKTAHAGQQKVFDLDGPALDIVKGWITGDNTSGSFLMKASDETGTEDTNNYLDFYSEQTTAGDHLKPKLKLYYYTDIQTCEDAQLAGLLMKADLNQDCYVDIEDIAEFAGQWLECNDPQDARCQN